MTSATGWRVLTRWSFSVRIVSRPQRTPSWPSYLPPVGTESTCEPIRTGGSGSAPGRSPKMLPIWSTVTRRPASRMRATIQSRPRLSSSVKASRVRPPRGVSPILPRSSMDRSSRFRSMPIRPPAVLESEIRPLEPLVAQQLARPPLEHELPALEHARPVGERERLADVLLHQQDRDSVRVDRPHRLEDPRDEHGRQAERRLVEHEHARAGHECAADRAHLLLAARERARELRPPVGEDGEQRVDVLDRRRALGPRARRVRPEEQVLDDAHEGEQAAPLRHLDDPALDPPMRGDGGQILAAEEDASPPRRHEAGDDAQRGGLARSVGADERDDLALAHLERDRRERLHITIEGIDRVKPEQG